MNPFLTHDEVAAIVNKNIQYLQAKVKARIKFKLKRIETNEKVEDLVFGVVVKILDRHMDGLVHFVSEAKVVAYILRGCWLNYINDNVKPLSKKSTPEEHEEDWFAEGTRFGHLPVRKRKEEANMVSIDLYEHLESEPTRDETDQDLTDSYYTNLYQKLFDYLNECVLTDKFRFDEVNIYKQYVLNDWTMKELVQNSDFKRSYVFKAVRKIKADLQANYQNIKSKK